MRIAIRLAALAALLPAGVASAATLIHAGRLIDGVGGHAARARDRRRGRRPHPLHRCAASPRPASGDDGRRPLGRDRAAGLHGHARAPDRRSTAAPASSTASRRARPTAPTIRSSTPSARCWRASRPCATSATSGTSRSRCGARSTRARSRARASSRPGRSIGTRGGHADATNSFGPFLTATTRGSTRCATAPTAAARPCASATRTAPTRSRSPRPAACSRSRSPAAPRSSPTRSSQAIDLDGPRLRHEGRRARARRRGHQARGQERHRLDRARHLHGRRGHPPHEGERHALRADDLRGPLGLRPGPGPDLFPGDRAARRRSTVGPQIQQTFGKAWKAGVTIMFGTDCGVCAARRQRRRNSATWSRRACR